MKVRTREVPADRLNYLTVNKQYKLTAFCDRGCSSGHITDDQGDELFILLEGCSYLNDKDWEVVEETCP